MHIGFTIPGLDQQELDTMLVDELTDPLTPKEHLDAEERVCLETVPVCAVSDGW